MFDVKNDVNIEDNEIITAVKSLKNGKASDIDGIINSYVFYTFPLDLFLMVFHLLSLAKS